ncbi:hypothetical protein M8J76_008223 [Diaphorina citri]|nr:hypothetical protein M8J76_008223 [Diaphorina citri]
MSSFQQINLKSIDNILQDPFYNSIYLPLPKLDEDFGRKIADIFKDTNRFDSGENRINEPVKTHMKIMYGIDADKQPMRTRKREPYNQNEEMMRTRKREPYNQNEEMMRTRKREPYNDNEIFNSHENQEPMRTRKREPYNQNEEMMRTRKREPYNDNEIFNSHENQQPMRTRKREPYNQNEEMMRTRKREPCHQNEEMMRTRKREPYNQNEFFNSHEHQPMNALYNLESCEAKQFAKYTLNTGNETCISKRYGFYGENEAHECIDRQKREVLQGDQEELYKQYLEAQKHEEREVLGPGEGLAPIKRFDFNQTIIEHFFEYDAETLSHIVMEILEERSRENYDNAFIEVFKVINKDDYDSKPLNERVFLFRKFLRLYKEYNDETLRGVMFDLPKKMKNHAIEKFLNNNPSGRDFLSYWETEEEIDIRFRNLYQQFQHALIERNFEMEQQLYELACPKGFTEMMMNLTTNSIEALSAEAEEKRLRMHAKKYLRRKLNMAAMLSTTTAAPVDMVVPDDMVVERTE